jgi:polysaccharide chain length determinant protein (PEP-CTERM system associated)
MGEQLRRALEIVRGAWSRRRWLAIVVFVAPLAAVIGAVPALPDVYKASAVILVERQQVPEEFVRSTVTSGLETRLHTISQEILSRSRLEELIERFDLYPELRRHWRPEAVAQRMRSSIDVELRGLEAKLRSNAIVAFTISYVGGDARTVAAVTNTLASSYLEAYTRARERQASGTAEFLRRQLGEVEQRLAEQEGRLSAFKARHLGETPQHMESNLSILDRLNTQLRLNNENQNRALERRELLTRRLAEAESSSPRLATTGALGAPPEPESPAARLARLRQELADLRTRFSERYPDVVRTKAEIAAAESQARSSPDNRPLDPAPPDPRTVKLAEALGELETEIKALKGEERRLREDLAAYQRRVENTPRREQEFHDLSRGYETTSELYRTLLRRYEEAQLAETLEQRQKGEQFRILEPAIPSRAPFAPNRLWLALLGVGGSLAAAVATVWLAEQFDGSLHTMDDLRAFTAASVVASIPPIVTRREVTRRRWRLAVATVTVIVGVGLLAGVSHSVARGNEQLVWLLARGRL